jgi:putative sterol carrier protein
LTTLAQTAAPAGLSDWLRDFQSRFNANLRAAKLASGWDRRLLVEATDTGARHVLTVTGARLTDISDGGEAPADDGRLVTMIADEATLVDIFSGEYNPSSALIDGQLEVFSDSRDKVKLEALALVIWGL